MEEKSLRIRFSFRSDTSFERASAARTCAAREGRREGGREGERERERERERGKEGSHYYGLFQSEDSSQPKLLVFHTTPFCMFSLHVSRYCLC